MDEKRMKTNNRKETAARAEQILKTAIDTLAAALERGHSDGLRQHLAAMARFHRYSFGNALLIFTQKPDATHVEGFRTWPKLGRHVRKGEKGILIRAPYSVRRKDVGEEDGQTFIGFKAAYVFDISQTEGDELPTIGTASGEPGANIDALKDFAQSRGIELRYDEDLASERRTVDGSRFAKDSLQPKNSQRWCTN